MKPTYSATLTVEQAQEMVSPRTFYAEATGILTVAYDDAHSGMFDWHFWITEPAPLPLRTHVAFGLLTFINLAWSVLFGWIVTRRKVLYAQHRVIAGWMALAFCAFS